VVFHYPGLDQFEDIIYHPHFQPIQPWKIENPLYQPVIEATMIFSVVKTGHFFKQAKRIPAEVFVHLRAKC
jgi:hypothetical protein